MIKQGISKKVLNHRHFEWKNEWKAIKCKD